MLHARFWLWVFSARDLVYFRSISSLPSHCVWGLGFISPLFHVFIVLGWQFCPKLGHLCMYIYVYIWTRVPGLALSMLHAKKNTLKFKIHLTCLRMTLWSHFHCLHKVLTGLFRCACVAEPVLGYIPCASSHTMGMGLSENSTRSWTVLGWTIHQIHPSWGLECLGLFEMLWGI